MCACTAPFTLKNGCYTIVVTSTKLQAFVDRSCAGDDNFFRRKNKKTSVVVFFQLTSVKFPSAISTLVIPDRGTTPITIAISNRNVRIPFSKIISLMIFLSTYQFIFKTQKNRRPRSTKTLHPTIFRRDHIWFQRIRKRQTFPERPSVCRIVVIVVIVKASIVFPLFFLYFAVSASVPGKYSHITVGLEHPSNPRIPLSRKPLIINPLRALKNIREKISVRFPHFLIRHSFPRNAKP